jgi:menaquinone-dependent protoporphyrinogen oxidase
MSTSDQPAGVLVAFASKHGSTAEIAEAVAGELRRRGLCTDCRPVGDVKDLDGYDAVVLGSAVYMKRWRHDARRLLQKHRRELAELPFWIFSSGPFGENPDPAWAEPPNVVKEAEKLGARDHTVFGGRLPVEPAGFLEKAMVRDTPPEVADLRDWEQIRGWAAGIAAALQRDSQGVARA